MVNNAGVRRFLREIRKNIPGGGKQKKQIVEQVKASILEYVAEMPDATYDDLLARFGTPEQIAASYLEEMDISDIRKQLAIRKKIMLIISLSAICIVLLWIGVVSAAWIHSYKHINGHIESVVEVEERIPIEEGN